MKRPFQTRLELINRAYSKWHSESRLSHLDLAASIVEASDEMGISSALNHVGITWSTAPDIDRRRATNSQILRRALGHHIEVCTGKEEALFEIERAIVAAMPADLRVEYLSSLYPGVVICKPLVGGPTDSDAESVIDAVLNEANEANVALFHYQRKPSYENATRAIKELNESINADQNSIAWVKADWDKQRKSMGEGA